MSKHERGNMSRTISNNKHVKRIFRPNNEGYSEWFSRDYIDTTELQLGKNGNIRQNKPWSDKYKWEIKRAGNRPTGRPIAFRTIGNSHSRIPSRPISQAIREDLLNKYPKCLHCGTDRSLVVDHKNDTYSDPRVLDVSTQNVMDFQILCNGCNNNLKHNAHVREQNTGRLHVAKDVGIIALKYDPPLPWEAVLTKYNAENKIYTYWFDIEEFWRKRSIFIYIMMPCNREILQKVSKID